MIFSKIVSKNSQEMQILWLGQFSIFSLLPKSNAFKLTVGEIF